MEFLDYLAVYGVGAVAGFLNVMAGGGSLLTLPVLMFLGLDAALANGTNRVAILAQNIAAVGSFRRHRLSDIRGGLRFSAATLPGAVLGAVVAVTIPQEMFAAILGVVIVASAVGLLGKRPSKPESAEASRTRPAWLSYLSFFAIGWYGGFIQAGIGFLFLLVFHRQLKLDLVRANMYKVFVVGCYTIPALAVFIATDNVDWAVGLTLAAGNASGAIVSTTVSVRRGEKPIRVVLALVLVAMSIRLIVGSF